MLIFWQFHKQSTCADNIWVSISPAGPTLGYTTALNDVGIIIIIIVVLYEALLNSWMCLFHKVSRHYILCNIGEISFVKGRGI